MSHDAYGYDSRSRSSSTGVPVLFNVDASANARHTSPFAAPAMPRGMIDAPGGFMFGVEQYQTYRSVMLPQRASGQQQQQQQGFNPLAQDGYLARAVDVSAYTRVPEPQQSWFQQAQSTSVYQQQAYGAFDSFGAPQKHLTTSSTTPAHFHTDAFMSSMKQLELPRLEAMLISVPAPATAIQAAAATPELELPAMPLYLEATSFSCPQNAHVWTNLKAHLQQAGVIVAEEDATKYQIKCHSTIGISCSEFNIRCYNGHYREVGVATAAAPGETGAAVPAASGGSFFTIEWQRRAGCSYGFMQLFRHVLATLAAHFSTLSFDSKIAPAAGVPAVGEEEVEPGSTPEPAADDEIDMSDVDVAGLAMPCLSRNGTSTATVTSAPAAAACFSSASACDKSSLYDSLLDLLSSDASSAQVTGMNALALCLDGAHPRAGELLAEVAAKLRNGQDAEVRQAAARLVAQAANTEGASAAAVAHCLPTVLAQLTSSSSTSSASGVTGDALTGAFACATQKSLLRSCVALSASVPAALDEAGGVLASSRLKRELLRACAHADEETRGLAMQAVRTIQV